jgi:hypothetical protein
MSKHIPEYSEKISLFVAYKNKIAGIPTKEKNLTMVVCQNYLLSL